MSKNFKDEPCVVWMPCKVYVKKYLLENFGKPDSLIADMVDLSGDKTLHRMFLAHLKRGSQRRDSEQVSSRYTEMVAVELKAEHVKRHGYLLTSTELTEVNRQMEERVKHILRTYYMMLSCVGVSVEKCIERFRSRTGIDEDDWSTDSMAKEIRRHCEMDNGDVYRALIRRMEKRCWKMLKAAGMIREEE